MARFFIPEFSESTAKYILSDEHCNHIKVLRIRPGDEIVVCDGKGTDYICIVTDVRPGYCAIEKKSAATSKGEPTVHVSLFVAFSKGDKIELVIQKAVELGCSTIVAFPSRRCVSTPDDKALSKKLQRWNKISAEAASQCGRGIIPSVLSASSFTDALSMAISNDLAVFLYEEERANSLKSVLSDRSFQSLAFMTGPEGGFDPEEAQLAIQSGLVSASLGPRILRCETAPLCALAAAMYHTDNL